MAEPVVLDSKTHRNTRVVTARGARFGENVQLAPVIADELNSLVLDYPVFLLKDEETGQFGLHAVLGFEPGENLYLEDDGWRASYVPLHVRRQPFMVGVAASDGDEGDKQQAVVTIDMQSRRVQEAEGEALFNADGSKTAYLAAIERLLGGLVAGIESTNAYIAQATELELIEAARVNVTFENGDQRSFEGLYTINADKLNELSGGVLNDMHRNGYLQASHLLLASMGQMQKLIAWKNTAARAVS